MYPPRHKLFNLTGADELSHGTFELRSMIRRLTPIATFQSHHLNHHLHSTREVKFLIWQVWNATILRKLSTPILALEMVMETNKIYQHNVCKSTRRKHRNFSFTNVKRRPLFLVLQALQSPFRSKCNFRVNWCRQPLSLICRWVMCLQDYVAELQLRIMEHDRQNFKILSNSFFSRIPQKNTLK